MFRKFGNDWPTALILSAPIKPFWVNFVPVGFIASTFTIFLLVLFNLSQDINQPFLGFVPLHNPITNQWGIWPSTPTWWSGVQPGLLTYKDVFITIEGEPYGLNLQQIVAEATARQQQTISIVVTRDEQQIALEIPLTVFTVSDFFDLKLADILSGLSFWLLAIMVYRAQPSNPINRAFVALSCLHACNVYLGGTETIYPLVGKARFFTFLWFTILGPFRPTLLLHFALLFPSRHSLYRPFVLYTLYSLTFLTGILWALARWLWLENGWSTEIVWLDFWANYYNWGVGIIGFFLLLVNSLKISLSKDKSLREKRQATFWVGGCLVAAIYYVPLVVLFFFQEQSYFYWNNFDLRYFEMSIPLFLTYSITRYQTFQNTRSSLAVPAIALAGLVTEIGATIWRNALGINSSSPVFLLFCMTLAVSLVWINQVKLSGFLGKLFHWEQRSYEAVNRFGQKLVRQTDIARLPAEIAQTLVSELELAQAAVWLWRENQQSFELLAPAGQWLTPLPPRLPLQPAELASFTRPVHLNHPNLEIPKWLIALPQPAELAVPLLATNRTIGFLAIGKRWDEEIFDDRDLTIIELISQQATLFIQTAQQIDEIRHIPSLLDEAQERERTKIAQDLHDTIQQFLGRLPFFLEISRPGNQPDASQADQILNQCIQDVEEAARTLRQIRHDLTIDQVEKSLTQPLYHLIERAQRLSGVQIKIDLPPNLDQSLPKQSRYALYRVIGQALDNAIEHANPTLIQVNVDYYNSQVRFIITDNGCGSSEEERQKAQSQGSFGLKSMAARIQNLGGEFHFSSTLTVGSQVTGWLPAIMSYE